MWIFRGAPNNRSVEAGIELQVDVFWYIGCPMASNADPAQLKKFGFILLGLGVVMAVAGMVMETSWQLYAGIGAAVLGGAVAAMGFMKK